MTKSSSERKARKILKASPQMEEFKAVLDRLDLKGILALQALLAQQALKKVHQSEQDIKSIIDNSTEQ